MSLSLILTEIIAKNSSDQRKKKIQDTIQDFTYGFFITLIGYLAAIAFYTHQYQIPIGLIYTNNGSGDFILSLIIVLCSGLLFHYINSRTMIVIEKLKDFQARNKGLKGFKKIKNYFYGLAVNTLFLQLMIPLIISLIYIIIINILLCIPTHIQDSFDSNDIKILNILALVIAIIITIGVAYKINKEYTIDIGDSIVLLFLYLLLASILAMKSIFNVFQLFITDKSDPLLWMFTFTTPIVLFCIIVSNRNPQNLSTKKIRLQKKIALAILLSLTFSAIIPNILSTFQIIQKRPIVLLSAIDKKIISSNQTLLVDHTDHFVAYDPVEKYSKVYQKSQYDWKPDRSVKTTESKSTEK
ncbi:MAG: hypothetical protein KF820_00025 [Candidatus Paracaedibacteraceae bacterium]|nr:hypothetical protein [Candidatus Paracaedibacteraceae bacterium]